MLSSLLMYFEIHWLELDRYNVVLVVLFSSDWQIFWINDNFRKQNSSIFIRSCIRRAGYIRKDQEILPLVSKCNVHILCQTEFCAVLKNCVLLGYYAACSGNILPKFKDNLSVPFSTWLLKTEPIYCPETSVRIYNFTLRNSPEERSFLLRTGGSPKSLFSTVQGNKLMFLWEWRAFPSAPCLAGNKKPWWQLASRCCWNRARPWHASEPVSFLVGLRTYQYPGMIRDSLTWIWILYTVIILTSYRVIRIDSRGFNNLSYTIYLR
jgi:hypothetical protein